MAVSGYSTLLRSPERESYNQIQYRVIPRAPLIRGEGVYSFTMDTVSIFEATVDWRPDFRFWFVALTFFFVFFQHKIWWLKKQQQYRSCSWNIDMFLPFLKILLDVLNILTLIEINFSAIKKCLIGDELLQNIRKKIASTCKLKFHWHWTAFQQKQVLSYLRIGKTFSRVFIYKGAILALVY